MSSTKAKYTEDKHNFDDIYNHPTSVRYYHEILIALDLVERNEIAAKYAEMHVLPTFKKWAEQLGKPLLFLDFLSSFGNDTLIFTNSFHATDFEKMWANEETCHTLSKPRQFPVKTWAADLSSAALNYGLKAGIFDETEVLNINDLSQQQIELVHKKCKDANILTMNSFTYVKDGILEQVLDWFAEGTEPGMLIIGFIYPYDGVDRIKKWKGQILKKYDFFNNIPAQNRLLDENERQKYGTVYGTWTRAYYEYWFVTRKGH